jgi:hypothetical protein
MILKPSLSFAGPREYRWQGLEVPAMMGKRRRGTAQIATASLEVCAASNRHKNLLFFATRSLAVYSRRNMMILGIKVWLTVLSLPAPETHVATGEASMYDSKNSNYFSCRQQ